MQRCVRVLSPSSAMRVAATLRTRATVSSSSLSRGGRRRHGVCSVQTTLLYAQCGFTSSSSLSSAAATTETAAAASLSFADVADVPTLGLVDKAFLACQAATGAEAWLVLLLAGAATRLMTLACTLYSDRAAARMRRALAELQAPQATFAAVYHRRAASALEVQMAASVLRGQRRRVYAAHGTSALRCLSFVCGSPVVAVGFMCVSALCANPYVGVGAASFAWCGALAQSDPLALLPFACCALTLTNFELSLAADAHTRRAAAAAATTTTTTTRATAERSMREQLPWLPAWLRRRRRHTGWMHSIVWGVRLCCLCAVPAATSLRAGVCLYWLGMNAAGLLHPLLVRTAAYQRWLAAPPPAARNNNSNDNSDKKKSGNNAATVGDVVLDDDALRARLLVQFPCLGQLLCATHTRDGERAAALLAPAVDEVSGGQQPAAATRTTTTTRSRATAHEVPAAQQRYAAGVNPLMRETPLHRRLLQQQQHGGSTAAAPTTATASTTTTSPSWRAPMPALSSLRFSESDFVPSYTQHEANDEDDEEDETDAKRAAEQQRRQQRQQQQSSERDKRHDAMRYKVAGWRARQLAYNNNSNNEGDESASGATTTTAMLGDTTVDAVTALLPLNALSRLCGQLAESDALPRAVHTRLIELLVWWYGVSLSEAALPSAHDTRDSSSTDDSGRRAATAAAASSSSLSSTPCARDYATLQQFYIRPWRRDARPVAAAADGAVAVAPCDGVVLAVHDAVDADTTVQVKGVRYGLRSLLRLPVLPAVPSAMRRVAVTLHLRTGDFHHVIAPRSFCCDGSVYVPGALLPTTPAAWHLFAGLPTLNERVVVHGRVCGDDAGDTTASSPAHKTRRDKHTTTMSASSTASSAASSPVSPARPLLAMALVGSTLSGRIRLAFDGRLRTNVVDPPEFAVHISYNNNNNNNNNNNSDASDARGLPLSRGAHIGTFYWGSAVVLVIDVPQCARVLPRVGECVRAGAPLLTCDTTTTSSSNNST